jgi:hypothetical protein
MKTQRIFGILWLGLSSYIAISWLWLFVANPHFFRPIQSVTCLVYLFGVVASLFLLRGFRWSRIAVGIIGLLTASTTIYEIARIRHWPTVDGYVGIFGLITALILLFPRHEPVV